MAEISLTADELNLLEARLQNERASLPADEVALIEALLAKARQPRRIGQNDPGWVFNVWTWSI